MRSNFFPCVYFCNACNARKSRAGAASGEEDRAGSSPRSDTRTKEARARQGERPRSAGRRRRESCASARALFFCRCRMNKPDDFDCWRLPDDDSVKKCAHLALFCSPTLCSSIHRPCRHAPLSPCPSPAPLSPFALLLLLLSSQGHHHTRHKGAQRSDSRH